MFTLCCSVPRCRTKGNSSNDVKDHHESSDDIRPIKLVSIADLSQPRQFRTNRSRSATDDPTSTSNQDITRPWNIPKKEVTAQMTLAKRCSGTLENVKTTLIRHLPFDQSTDSRTSIGTSEEEVARRLELRQIRNKRIQSELGPEDERSNSLHASLQSNRHLSPYVDISQPGNGPRDTIEFSVDDNHSQVVDLCPPPVPSPVSIRTSTSHKALSTKTVRSNASDSDNMPPPANTRAIIELVSKSTNDEAGVTKPQQVHYSGTSVPVGLSPSINRRESQKPPAGSQNNADSSGLSLWLAAQALRSSTIENNDPVDSSSNESSHSFLEDFGGIDRIVEMPMSHWTRHTVGPLALQSLLPEHSSKFTRPSLPRSSSLQGNWSKKTEDETVSSKQPEELTESAPSTTRKDESGETEPDSSFYPSKIPSFAPSLNHSQPYVNILSNRDLESLELSPFEWHDRNSILKSPGHSEDCSSYGTAEEYLPTPPSRVFANASSTPSELSSVYQREAELQTIPKRFAAILSKPRSSSGRVTRFTESFEDLSHVRPQRHSFLGRLTHGQSELSKMSTAKDDHEAIEMGGSRALKDFLTGTLPVNIRTECEDIPLRRVSGQPQQNPNKAQQADRVQRRVLWPIESWSKYPSHNRKLRAQQAGIIDKVRPKDLTMRRVLSDGKLEWSTNNSMSSGPMKMNQRAATIPARMTNVMKSGFSKLLSTASSNATLRLKTPSSNTLNTNQAEASSPIMECTGCTSTSREHLLQQPLNETHDSCAKTNVASSVVPLPVE